MVWTVNKAADSDDVGIMGVKLDPGLDVCFYRV